MRRLSKRQKGFTLIELLVVIAILGVMAFVVSLSVGGLFGVGKVEAANVELHQLETAIVTYITTTEGSNFHFDATIGPESNYPLNATFNEGVYGFLYGKLQADYFIVDGTIVNATPVESSKWFGLYFCDGAWQEEECS